MGQIEFRGVTKRFDNGFEALRDVTAQFDYPNVIAQSEQRSGLIKAKYYRHFSIPGASHNYVDVEPVVFSWLRGWMLKQKIEQKSKPPVRPPKLRRR